MITASISSLNTVNCKHVDIKKQEITKIVLDISLKVRSGVYTIFIANFVIVFFFK